MTSLIIHYVVLAKIQIRDRWEFIKKCKSKGRHVNASERLERKEIKKSMKRKYVRSLEKLG